ACAFLSGRALEAEDGVPLVIAGEDHSARLPGALHRLLDVHETAEEIQPGVALPNAFPQVGGGMAVGVGRIAGAATTTLVEGQEACAVSFEPRGYGNEHGIDGEVHHRPRQSAVLRG